MNAALVMFKADGTRRDFPLRAGTLVVGRKNSCELRIPLSSVSRQHCELAVEGDEIKLRDLGSSNGTYHNSIRVQEATLAAGDEIVVGPVVFTLVVDGVPEKIEPVRTILNADDSQSSGATLAVDQPVAVREVEMAPSDDDEIDEPMVTQVIDDDDDDDLDDPIVFEDDDESDGGIVFEDDEDEPEAVEAPAAPAKPKKPEVVAKEEPLVLDDDEEEDDDPIAALEAMASKENGQNSDSSILEFDFDDLDDD